MAGRLPWRRPVSVRARTTLLATVVVALALLLGATALVLVLQRSLARSGDDAAQARARDLAALAGAGGLPSVLPVPGDEQVAQVVDGHGEVLAASASLGDAGPVTAVVPSGPDPSVHTARGVPDDAEREDYRVWALEASTPDGPVVVYVGTSLEAVRETVRTVQTVLAVGLPPLLALLAYTTWVVVGRALRPVEVIRAEVADISGHDLARRVPEPATRDEVGRLARTMNAMLDRLEDSSTRQRTFVADASHEMQSPLAALRTQIEVALARPDGTDWPEVARGLLADGARLERLVRDLLFLARTDETPDPPPATLVDLDDVVLEEAARVRTSAVVPVDTRDVSAAPVRGSRDELARLVRNLLENGVRHARTALRVGLTSGTGGVVLTVSDDGPGIPAAERQRVFDRFVRLDGARTREDGPSAGGAGLGLALVSAVARRHGGTVRVEDAAPGARLVVDLPSETSADAGERVTDEQVDDARPPERGLEQDEAGRVVLHPADDP